MAINKIKTNSISDSAVTSATIQDSAVTNAKISACAAIAQSKVSGLASSLSTLCSSATSLTSLINTNQYNIALLGFKMAITEGLTVFNLVDGIVDEFEDEGGTDGSASTNLTYNSTDDYYVNSNTPDGGPAAVPYSAGFSTTSITEPDTSVTQTNPTQGTGTAGAFTVPTGMTSVTSYVFGAGGGGGGHLPQPPQGYGGGGGFVTGSLAVTPTQVLEITVGEGGAFGNNGVATGSFEASFGGASRSYPTPGAPFGFDNAYQGGGGSCTSLFAGLGGGLSAVGTSATVTFPNGSPAVPGIAFIAGAGGGGGSPNLNGGSGGGTTARAGGNPTSNSQTSANGYSGGGGSQTTGGASAGGNSSPQDNGVIFSGGNGKYGGSGGAGYYGGGGSAYGPGVCHAAGGGGSSYYGHPQVTSGSTQAGTGVCAGGKSNPNYTACTAEGGPNTPQSPGAYRSGEDGYVLLIGCGSTPATTTSSTIISDPFTASTVPTTTRIVVFEENVGTPSLNTDIIASVSRNGGTNFTNVTLTDSGYVTGSSGQRILTGTATISGQPSGQSMKWKLQLANNTVKIHGVALQWS